MPLLDNTLRADVRAVFDAAVHAVEGERCVYEALQDESLPDSVAVIALGKAAVSMTRGAVRALGCHIQRAWIVTKHGYEGVLPWPVETAGHPVPDEHSLVAGARLHRFIADTPPEQAVLVLLSGGASSLVEILPEGVTLDDWRALNRWLLAAGLDIGTMNRIRTRASLLKGGRMAGLLAPRSVLCLAISDVPSDDPALIGSGPLVAMPATAASVPMPDFLRPVLSHAGSPPAGSDDCFRRVRYRIVARREDALAAAAVAARALGYDANPVSEILCGDAFEAGARMARELLSAPHRCVRVYGGETTVTLPNNPGRGGRNQALALAAARVIDGEGDCALLAAGTDGSDGPGRDAGALVDSGTIARGRAAGLDATDALCRADAGTFLAASGDLIVTGPTGTNVMDLCVGLQL